MEIKCFKTKNFDDVISLHKQIFHEDNNLFFENLKTKDYYHCFVASHQNQIVAYCIISKIADQAELFNIATIEGFRNKGIAKQLLIYAISNVDAAEMFLEVSTKNLAAIKLYQSVGFNEIDRRKKYYGDSDAIIMRLQMN